MNKYLTKQQVAELVAENRYTYLGEKYRSRCFSAYYDNLKELPALAIPGGDIGELSILLASAQNYGFELNLKKASEVLFKIIGGKKNFSFSTVSTHSAEECCHFHYLLLQPNDYNLNKEDVTELLKVLKVEEITPPQQLGKGIKGGHNACIILEGSEGVLPQYYFNSIEGSFESHIFVYHKTLIDERHKVLSTQLIESNAVKLPDNLGDDYLYEVLSEVSDLHLYQTLHKLDSNLPIFSVKIDEKGQISVESLI